MGYKDLLETRRIIYDTHIFSWMELQVKQVSKPKTSELYHLGINTDSHKAPGIL